MPYFSSTHIFYSKCLLTGRHFMNISTTVLQGQMSYLYDALDVQRPVKVNPGILFLYKVLWCLKMFCLLSYSCLKNVCLVF